MPTAWARCTAASCPHRRYPQPVSGFLTLVIVSPLPEIPCMSAAEAHDFRNILLVIRGYTACLRSSLDDPRQLEDLEEIEKAADRGAALVNQLAANAPQAAA